MVLQKWIAKIAFAKIAKRLIALGVARLLALPLDAFGITIDENQATVGLYGLVELARNFVKTKFGVKWL